MNGTNYYTQYENQDFRNRFDCFSAENNDKEAGVVLVDG